MCYSKPATCKDECLNRGYAGGSCKISCGAGETDIGNDNCPTGQVCCCSGVSTTTTTTPPGACDNDGVCEAGETQHSCSNDCKTIVDINPRFVHPGDMVTITVEFWDSRFNADQGFNVKMRFFILPENIIWEEDRGNPFHEKEWKELWDREKCGMRGAGKHCHGEHENFVFDIWVEDYHGKMSFRARIPEDLPAGVHRVAVIPILSSKPIPLKPAETQIVVGNAFLTLVQALKNLFTSITGMFALHR
ncbi:hypothetical protein DRJ19_06025 [Candidatus Woesearchaeota archaeon]|nr:MAG: hypothetical protein DRJ19_06025 [Candidatus Woesearchaeota archaeon]